MTLYLSDTIAVTIGLATCFAAIGIMLAPQTFKWILAMLFTLAMLTCGVLAACLIMVELW